jgi:D-alanyl-lipoteichoic acid acyltransferase DltB (MBOAT superfamily)
LLGGATTSADAYICCIAFVLRIYCDFSGYTDMARGVAKLFGIDLSLNFNLPFFSPTPAALWTRWHITLNHWMRDYVYGPLRRGLLDRGMHRRFALPLSTAVTFFLMGLWHGANAGFMLWGGF